MRINLADERKRLFISIGSALVIHIVILVLAGINSGKLDYVPEFGPLTVEVSFDRTEVKPVEPEPPEVETFEEAEAPKVEAVQPEIQPNPPAPAAIEVRPPRPEPAAAAAPVYTPPSPAPAAVDNSIIESIRNRTGGNNAGVDARSVFGDDRVPATTDSSTSGATAGSDVVLSDAVPETQPPAVAEQVQQQTSVLDSSQLSSLDRSLESGTAGGSPSVTGANSTSSAPVAGPVSGNSPNVVFNDPKVTRKLLKWPDPVIPEEVRKEGRSQYIVEVELEITPDGLISKAEISKTSGNTMLDAAVKSALRNWSFAPNLSTEKNVRAVLTYVIEIK